MEQKESVKVEQGSDVSGDTDGNIEIHDNCDAIIVHPTGQLQIVKECWCKLYHIFGQNIEFHEVIHESICEDIQCCILLNGEKYQQPPNRIMERKLNKKVIGAGILFRKGFDLSLEKAKSLLVR